MVVDFAIRKFPGCAVASVTYVGPYRGEDMMRDEFYRLMDWAKGKKLRTGRWFFIEDDTSGDDKKRKWEACVELKSKARSGKGVKVKALPAEPVATIKFDPEKISPRVIYHGLGSWLESRKKDHEYKQAGKTREVYRGDPWKSASAWANVEIQVPVKKLK